MNTSSTSTIPDSAADQPQAVELAVIVLNYRTPGMVIDCLDSLEGQIQAPAQQVVVVDNNSGDDSADQIQGAIRDRRWDTWVRFVQSPTNGGFAAGNNVGIRSIDAQVYLLLNSDTIVRPSAVELLYAYLQEHQTVGIVGSRLENPDGSPQRSAFNFPGVLSNFENGAGIGLVSRLLRPWITARPVEDHAHTADWVCGASMMIRGEVFDQIGLLDDCYFMYFEETDFCLAAKRAGFECWYVPSSRVVHLVGMASGISNEDSRVSMRKRMPAYWFASRQRFYRKNFGMLYTVFVDIAWISGLAVNRLWRFVLRRESTWPQSYFGDALRSSSFLNLFPIVAKAPTGAVRDE